MYMTYLTARRVFSKNVLRLATKMNLFKESLILILLPCYHHSNLSNTNAHEAPTFLLQAVCMMTSPSPSIIFLLKSPNACCYKIKLRFLKLASRFFHLLSMPIPQERLWRELYIAHCVAKSSVPATSKSSTQHSGGGYSDILKLWASGKEVSFGHLCLPSSPSLDKCSGACALCSGACTLVSLN